MSKLKTYFLLLATIVVTYGLSIKYGFSQDDWYFLSISRAESLIDVLQFFNPAAQAGFAFYRPLGTQLYFFLAQFFLGLSGAPLGMHLFMLFIHSLSAFQVYRLVGKLNPNTRLPLLLALLYASSAVHFLSLYYISATQQLLAALFSLLSLNFFLDKKQGRAALFFALALLAKETAVVTPAIAFLLAPSSLPSRLRRLAPYIFTAGLYLLLRLSGGVSVQSEYHLVFNLSVISTLRWYYLFGYGAPEELVRYGLPRMAINLTQFIRDFGPTGLTLVLGSFGFTFLSLVRLIRRRSLQYLLWWLVAILPVVFLQDHRYPHYLDLALIPLFLLVLEGFSRRLQLILTSLLIVISLLSVHLSRQTHWTTIRALMSKRAQTTIASSQACAYPVWFVTGPEPEPRELAYALSLGNGPRVICNRQITLYYQGVAPTPPPAGAFILPTEGIVWP